MGELITRGYAELQNPVQTLFLDTNDTQALSLVQSIHNRNTVSNSDKELNKSIECNIMYRLMPPLFCRRLHLHWVILLLKNT